MEALVEQVDIDQLITLIQARPCLWDKADPNYKDRTLIKNAWSEVHRSLKEDFESLSDADKKIYGAGIIKKWTNLRDSFRRYYRFITKPPSGDKAVSKTKYVYYDQLIFLTKVFEERATEDSLAVGDGAALRDGVSDEESDVDEPDEVFSDSQNPASQNPTSQNPPPQNPASNKASVEGTNKRYSTTHQKNSQKKRAVQIEEKLLKALEPEEEDPKLYFFKSIVPLIKDFDSDEMLEFQMAVMSLVRNFKSRKQSQNQTFLSPMHSSPPDFQGHSYAYSHRSIPHTFIPPPPPHHPQSHFSRPATPNSHYAGYPPQFSPDLPQMSYNRTPTSSRAPTPTSSRTPTPNPNTPLKVSIPTQPDFNKAQCGPLLNRYQSSPTTSSSQSSSSGLIDETQIIDPVSDSA
ncbi:uncharacterized protein [Bemisia tabaci]|uniref:uncharacterized protein n=1 Tax=Bemisia tabaci TaxID=7038 RepID=UPI003B288335